MSAKAPIEVDAHVARQNLRLMEALEDLDDVQRVTANFDLPNEVLAELATA
jgi:transcriptional/translational regulatory protein YebC/TACO1